MLKERLTEDPAEVAEEPDQVAWIPSLGFRELGEAEAVVMEEEADGAEGHRSVGKGGRARRQRLGRGQELADSIEKVIANHFIDIALKKIHARSVHTSFPSATMNHYSIHCSVQVLVYFDSRR